MLKHYITSIDYQKLIELQLRENSSYIISREQKLKKQARPISKQKKKNFKSRNR